MGQKKTVLVEGNRSAPTLAMNQGLKSHSNFPEERFQELAPPMRPEEAIVEANRCLYCYDAPCIKACPTHIEIPRFIKQIASRNLAGSANTILEANAMGHSCARVCPVEVLCEGACVYVNWQKKPIEIARLQRVATDDFHKQGARRYTPGPDNGRRVAVIGAGPAGLSCAFYLRRLGHPVTVFERQALSGGLNTYGIAEYKMTRKVSLDEVRMVVDLGADVRTGVEVGKAVTLESLEREYSAIFVGIGLGETRALRVPGEQLNGVWDALSFISKIKARDVGAISKSAVTVVIGAGNTAIDAVTQAKRLGAEKVIMAYRRGPEDMSAYDYEFELAKHDEIEFLWHAAPVEIIGKSRVEAIRFVRMETGSGDPKPISGSEFEVPCDRVIKAIGQNKQYSIAKAAGLKLDVSGRIEIDPKTLKTSNPRYFAGGDAINGGKEVVNAAADGKRAAWHIHKSLMRAESPSAEHAYWVGTIDGRLVAPIPARGAGASRKDGVKNGPAASKVRHG